MEATVRLGQSITGHNGFAVLKGLSANLTGMANSDEALTHVKHTYLRYSLQLCEGAGIIIPILQMKKKKTGHFGTLNSLPRVARFVCDGTYPGTQVSCYSPGGEACM